MNLDDDAPPDLVLAEPEDAAPNTHVDRIVPITLLTGYLGSGKTTLLQYILTADHGYRIAVCMNDFGDSTDIESTAMSFTPSNPKSNPTDQDPDSDDAPETAFLSLPNGCLCCSIKEPGIAAIENMILEQESRAGGSLGQQDEDEDSVKGSGTGNAKGRRRGVDRVVVELTGVADPAEIARSFWTNEEMGGSLRLDGVVCVVDSRNVLKQLEEGEECQKQIAASDVILLNKVDLVTDEILDDVERRIRSINPTAIFKRTHKSVIDIKNIFEIGSYSVAPTLNASQLADKFFDGDATTTAMTDGQGVGSGARERIGNLRNEHDHDHDDGSTPTESKHLRGITSLVINLPTVLPPSSLERLESFLQSIHWDSKFPGDPPRARPNEIVDKADEVESTEGFEILRSKGIFSFASQSPGEEEVEEEVGMHVLQGVRDIFELTRLEAGPPREKDGDAVDAGSKSSGRSNGGKLVLIGKRLGERDVWEKELFEALGV